MNIRTLLEDGNKAIDALEAIAKVAGALGVPFVSPAATAIAKITEIAQAALDKPEDLQIALSSTDQAELQALIDRSNATAAALEAEIDIEERRILGEP